METMKDCSEENVQNQFTFLKNFDPKVIWNEYFKAAKY